MSGFECLTRFMLMGPFDAHQWAGEQLGYACIVPILNWMLASGSCLQHVSCSSYACYTGAGRELQG